MSAVADGAIEALAAGEAHWREQAEHWMFRAIKAEHDLETWQLIAFAGVHHAHELHVACDRMRRRQERAFDENLRRVQLPGAKSEACHVA